jgi:hypothetical protein
VAGVTGMPRSVGLAGNLRFHVAACGKKFVPAPLWLRWRKSRKRDRICHRVFGKFFCAVAVR